MWEEGKSQKLAQTMSQAPEGQVCNDWQEIIGKQNDWDNIEMDQFVKMLQQL
jgi:hypothetical protein